jgi:hypothetical protein
MVYLVLLGLISINLIKFDFTKYIYNILKWKFNKYLNQILIVIEFLCQL